MRVNDDDDDIPLWFLAINENDMGALHASITDDNINEEFTDPSCIVWSPLIKAIRDTCKDAVVWLLSRGANPSLPISDGDTPLFAAYEEEEHLKPMPIFDLLLNAGAKDVRCAKTYLYTTSPTSATQLMVSAWAARNNERRAMQIRRMIHSAGGADMLKDIINLPQWVEDVLEARKRCTRAATIVLGLQRFKRTNVVCVQMARLLARSVLQTRGDEGWEE